MDLTDVGFEQLERLPEPVVRPVASPCPNAEKIALDLAIRLEVVVGCDGSVEKVRALNDVGLGCGAIAAEALASALFKPATDLEGSPARVTIRWDYVFRYEAADSSEAEP